MNRYGGAKTGDRTMLDALSPAINVLEQSSTLSGLQSAVEVGGAPILVLIMTSFSHCRQLNKEPRTPGR